jgi:hypothetical protein
MQITRTNILTQKESTMELDITQEQIDAFQNGAKVQDAFPNLTDDEREFILTGMSPEEWDATVPEEDEEDEENEIDWDDDNSNDVVLVEDEGGAVYTEDQLAELEAMNQDQERSQEGPD